MTHTEQLLRDALKKIEGGSFPEAIGLALGGDWQGMVNALQAIAREALTATASVTVEAEPVAWRYRHSEQENWHYGASPQNWWECQALYAAPSQAAAMPPAAQSVIDCETCGGAGEIILTSSPSAAPAVKHSLTGDPTVSQSLTVQPSPSGSELPQMPKPDIRIDAFGDIIPTDGRKFVMGDFYSAEQVRALLAGSSHATVPEWIKKPTDDMEIAGMEASLLGRPSVDDESYVMSIWNAMIAAAPLQKEGGEAG